MQSTTAGLLDARVDHRHHAANWEWGRRKLTFGGNPMARSNPRRNVDEIYDAAHAWSQRCLLQDGSIFSDQRLWTKDNVGELMSAVKGWGVDKSDASFLEKLDKEIAGTSPLAKKL